MALETLKEKTAREEAENKRAFKYQVAKDAAWTASERLKNLEAALAVSPPDLSVLREIWTLAGSLPPRFVTVGDGLVTGGQQLNHMIMRETQAAIDRVVAERKRLEDSLPEARRKAAEAEAKLKSFEAAA
jgi:hypothetical protein